METVTDGVTHDGTTVGAIIGTAVTIRALQLGNQRVATVIPIINHTARRAVNVMVTGITGQRDDFAVQGVIAIGDFPPAFGIPGPILKRVVTFNQVTL